MNNSTPPSRARVLVVDDEPANLAVVRQLLGDLHDIRVANQGQRALDLAAAAPPDLMLLDVDMPGLDGYEVARFIKSTPHLAHIPVILLTGAFEPVDQARAAEVGSDGVLAKPFEPQLVIQRVKELLARPRAGAPRQLQNVPAPSGSRRRRGPAARCAACSAAHRVHRPSPRHHPRDQGHRAQG